MELLLFRPGDYSRLYNCSRVNLSSVPRGERAHPGLGAFYLTSGTALFLLYLPCLAVIWNHRRESSCFRLMLAMGVLDLGGILIAGCFTGVALITGLVFCDAPTVVYVVGCFATGLWAAETTLETVLALNRCLNMACPVRVTELLFDGWRFWLWVVAPLAYGFFYWFRLPPALVCSIYASWLVSPYAGFVDSIDETPYVTDVQVWHDRTMSLSIPLIYGVFFAAYTVKVKLIERSIQGEPQTQQQNLTHNQQNNAQSSSVGVNAQQRAHTQKMVFLQVLLISVVNAVAAHVAVRVNDRPCRAVLCPDIAPSFCRADVAHGKLALKVQPLEAGKAPDARATDGTQIQFTGWAWSNLEVGPCQVEGFKLYVSTDCPSEVFLGSELIDLLRQSQGQVQFAWKQRAVMIGNSRLSMLDPNKNEQQHVEIIIEKKRPPSFDVASAQQISPQSPTAKTSFEGVKVPQSPSAVVPSSPRSPSSSVNEKNESESAVQKEYSPPPSPQPSDSTEEKGKEQEEEELLPPPIVLQSLQSSAGDEKEEPKEITLPSWRGNFDENAEGENQGKFSLRKMPSELQQSEQQVEEVASEAPENPKLSDENASEKVIKSFEENSENVEKSATSSTRKWSPLVMDSPPLKLVSESVPGVLSVEFVSPSSPRQKFVPAKSPEIIPKVKVISPEENRLEENPDQDNKLKENLVPSEALGKDEEEEVELDCEEVTEDDNEERRRWLLG